MTDIIHQINDVEFWKEINPELHICEPYIFNNTTELEISEQGISEAKELLKTEGYFQTEPPNWEMPINSMVKAIERIREKELLPVFCFLYDEFWLLFNKLSCYYNAILGFDYRMLPDFWAWYIDPSKEENGWKPHRDKKLPTVYPDGQPASLTTWIPLTDSTILNGCMYLVPKHLDKGGEKDGRYGFELSSIRALPAVAGSVLMWNQWVYHWGGKTSLRAKKARVSLAFEFQSSKIPPMRNFLLDPKKIYSFQERLSLIAMQISQYRHMYSLSDELLDWTNSFKNNQKAKS